MSAFGQTQSQADFIQAYQVTTPDEDHAFVGWFYNDNGIIHGPFKDQTDALIAIGVPASYFEKTGES